MPITVSSHGVVMPASPATPQLQKAPVSQLAAQCLGWNRTFTPAAPTAPRPVDYSGGTELIPVANVEPHVDVGPNQGLRRFWDHSTHRQLAKHHQHGQQLVVVTDSI